MLHKGEKAPDFQVMSHDGKLVKLSDFRGRKVVLWFYPKADTPGCTAEACGFRDRSEEFAAKDAVLLGVSFDTVEENAAFARKYAVDYPLLCDIQREVGMKYGACQDKTDLYAQRIAYLIDEAGMIEEVYAKVDARTFPEHILGEI